jgi:hypothetical protein
VPNPLGLLAFALVSVTVVDAYKAALLERVSSLDAILGLSVPFLQVVAKGPWGQHLDATITHNGTSIFKANAAVSSPTSLACTRASVTRAHMRILHSSISWYSFGEWVHQSQHW